MRFVAAGLLAALLTAGNAIAADIEGVQIADRVQRDGFDHLDAPILRVSNLDMPMPYASHLEELCLPTVERIARAVRQVCYREG